MTDSCHSYLYSLLPCLWLGTENSLLITTRRQKWRVTCETGLQKITRWLPVYTFLLAKLRQEKNAITKLWTILWDKGQGASPNHTADENLMPSVQQPIENQMPPSPAWDTPKHILRQADPWRLRSQGREAKESKPWIFDSQWCWGGQFPVEVTEKRNSIVQQ